MKAVTVQPGVAGSVRFEEVPEPDESTGSILVEAVAVGICGTDEEIASGAYGWAPPGRERLILGHESLGRVLDPGPNAGSLQKGDLIVGIVRRPGPRAMPQLRRRGMGHVPQRAVHRAGHQTDRRVHVRAMADRAGLLHQGGPVTRPPRRCCSSRPPWWRRPGSWSRAMRARAFWEPRQVLITGAGPIGMLAAMIGVQHGLDVHVLDRVTEGAKPQLVHDVGATYHSGAIADIGFDPDVIIECTGVGSVIIDSIRKVGAGGVVCLTGVGGGGQASGLLPADVAKDSGPGQQRGHRLGQRQPAALLPRGRSARRRRPGLARDG